MSQKKRNIVAANGDSNSVAGIAVANSVEHWCLSLLKLLMPFAVAVAEC